ncbi:MAG TPA: hypothetical protein VFP65_20755, partial [Anaeromyxobacteraceae bacterium]|nr:hypothetical protein [Anaeromyxobacteraceae bacterium]
MAPRLDRDGSLAADGLGGVGEDVQEHLVHLGPDAFHEPDLAVPAIDGDPIFQEMAEEGQARLDLRVQIDRLPRAVGGAGEDPEVAHDLARAVGALADASDHPVEVGERVV